MDLQRIQLGILRAVSKAGVSKYGQQVSKSCHYVVDYGRLCIIKCSKRKKKSQMVVSDRVAG